MMGMMKGFDSEFLMYWARQYDLICAVRDDQHHYKLTWKIKVGLWLMETGKKLIMKQLHVKEEK